MLKTCLEQHCPRSWGSSLQVKSRGRGC
jgi:hypothetical protein